MNEARSLMICDVCSSTYLWMVWCWFVWLGLTLGFWFQVGSHSCCQGDSGARGKKPLLFYLRPSPFCDHPKKKKKKSSISIFLLLHFLLSYCWKSFLNTRTDWITCKGLCWTLSVCHSPILNPPGLLHFGTSFQSADFFCPVLVHGMTRGIKTGLFVLHSSVALCSISSQVI